MVEFGLSASTIATIVSNKVITDVLPALLASYEPHNIFNADETALFYRAQPNKTLFYKNLDCNKTKVCKERLSLLLTANMDGSEKLRPIVIGKSKDPRCFQKINRANLPAYYRSNAKGWMTGVIFREWLNKLDRHYRGEKRHILLFVDGSRCDQFVQVQVSHQRCSTQN